jgi:hypothetical protein
MLTEIKYVFGKDIHANVRSILKPIKETLASRGKLHNYDQLSENQYHALNGTLFEDVQKFALERHSVFLRCVENIDEMFSEV